MTEPAFTRRTLLRATPALAVLPLLPLLGRRSGDLLGALAGPGTLRVGVLLASGDAASAASRGVALGAEESARTASLFALGVEVVEERGASTAEQVRVALQRLVSAGVAAVIVDARIPDADSVYDHACHSAVAAAARSDALVLSLGSAPGTPMVDRCRGFAVYMSPAEVTVRRARAAYARRRGASGADSAMIEGWHHTLRRFGAEQLNERFRRRFGVEMTSAAWAAWAAMKILTEAALRSRSTRGGDLARFFATPAARFDGHKGEPLAFDPRTGELRQPLYVIEGGSIAAELAVADLYERLR